MANQPTKYRKFLAGAATASLVATAVVPTALAATVETSEAATRFSDVPATDTHYENISQAVDLGLFKGKADGTFGTYENITRGQVAKVLANYVVKKEGLTYATYIEKHNLATTVTPFNDVPSTYADSELFNASLIVKSSGIFTGSNNNLMPSKLIVRQQMAKVLVNGFGLKDLPGDLSKVTDNNKALAEFVPHINILSENGVTTEEAFRPSSNVLRGQMASFLNRAYAIANPNSEVAPSVVSVSAINATTVEVTYKEAVSDIKTSDYTIEGLTVSNAAVKQTNDKVVVLTTSTQVGAKEYTVKSGTDTLGKFTGVSAVIPTDIEVTTASLQGTIGKEVTLSAQVTVPATQSKAGIPVTFNIVSDDADKNDKIEVVAYTNEAGVASYSYTRYYEENDSVKAYATDKSSVVDSATVYWAEALTVEEVTEADTLANGSKKVYKVTGAANSVVNVTFKENVQVSPDKVVTGAKVEDAVVKVLNADGTLSDTINKYPYEVTTGGVQVALVQLNSSGTATFTVTGSNATVTPVVFADGAYGLNGSWTGNGKLGATELQASAPTVKFDLSHTLGLVVTAEGVQNAAAITANGIGGRDYTVTVTNKDGQLAPEGTTVNVVFPEGSISTDKTVYFNSQEIDKDVLYSVTVGKEGKAKFTLTGLKDGFAAPTVFVNNGSDDAKLDNNDLQTVGEKAFFVDAVINNATLVAKVDGKEVTSTSGTKTVEFIYTSVDQNGKEYDGTPSNYEVSYEVTAQFGDVYAGPDSTLIKKGTTKTVKVNASSGVATLAVTSADPSVASQVTVNASASQVSLPNKSATVSFTNSLELPTIYTGYVTDLIETNETIKIDQYNPISYANGTYFNELNQPISKQEFVDALNNVATGDKAQVTVSKQADGTYKFNIKDLSVTKSTAELLSEAQANLVAIEDEVDSKVESTYTPASWTAFESAVASADALPEVTTTQINSKIAAYESAIAKLVTNASQQAALQAATERLNAAKDAADTIVEEDYTVVSYSDLADALAIADGTTPNQKNSKAAAIETAITNLLSKASFASFTIAEDETNAATGELLFTFTETSGTPVTAFAIGPVSTVDGAATGTVATATPSNPADNKVLLRITDDTATPAGINLTTLANQGETYTFTATVTKADFFAKDVIVEVKHNGTDWVAVVK